MTDRAQVEAEHEAEIRGVLGEPGVEAMRRVRETQAAASEALNAFMALALLSDEQAEGVKDAIERRDAALCCPQCGARMNGGDDA